MSNYERSFDIYLREIREIPRLTLSEEEALFKRYHEGDMEAKTRLIESNLKLVIYTVKKYYGCGMAFEDLVQEGNLALQKAIETFDGNKEAQKLSTYAVVVIDNHVRNIIRDQIRTIRIPRHYYTRIKVFKRVFDKFFMDYHRYPSLNEIAKIIGITEEEAQVLYNNSMDIISLNATYKDDGDEFGDSIEGGINPEEMVLKRINSEDILKWVINAPIRKKELDIILMHYGINQKAKTLSQIGEIFNVSKEAIRTTEERAFKKIKSVKYE